MDTALIDQAEGQLRAVAELRTGLDTAVAQFEVDWEIAEVGRFGVPCQTRRDETR